MSEPALSSPASFADYLADRYGLSLTQGQYSDVSLLIEEDREVLRLALYKFEDAVMKRKTSSEDGGADKERTLFLFGLQEAARKRNPEPDASQPFFPSQGSAPRLSPSLSDENPFEDPLDKSSCSLDELYLQVDTPQVSPTSPSPPQSRTSNSDCTISTCNTTPATSAHPTPALGVDLEAWQKHTILGDCDELRQHPARSFLFRLPFLIHYFLLNLVAARHLQWSSLPSDVIQAMLKATSSMGMVKTLRSSLPSIENYFTPDLLQICQDVDQEEAMLESGSKYLHCPQDDWVGGKVRFSGIINVRQDKTLRVQLKPPTIRSSSRFSRRFGSCRFLHLSLAKSNKGTVDKDALNRFLSEPILVANRTFKLLCIKEGKAAFSLCLFALDEEMPDMWSLYNWHSPWDSNAGAMLPKHMARIHLGLSTSVPGPRIPVASVRKMDDIDSSSGKVMTDGAAPISQAAMKNITLSLGLLDVPAAIQGRYDGAKGIWYISPDSDDKDNDLWIGVRPSQKKYHRQEVVEECHQVLDVLQVSRINTPSSLNKQIIPILTENGVPHTVFLQLQERMLEQLITDFLGERGKPKDGIALAKAMDVAGNLTRTRARRVAPHLALVNGLTSRAAEDFAEAADVQGDEEEEESSDRAADNQEGAPYMSMFEKAYEMLLTGFSVGASKKLSDLTSQAARALLARHSDNPKLIVDRSAEALVIPDPCGVLEEGEIQLRFGKHAPVDPGTKMRIGAITGSVLVTRLPCLIPTDVRKVTAVVYPELSIYQDVVIFSTKGCTPLADALSGGDYDGDLVRVIWEPDIVVPFCNADFDRCRPSISLDDAFDKDDRLVSDVYVEQSEEGREEQLNNLLKGPLVHTGMKGSLGKLHCVAAYMHGVSSQEAIDLAFKFNQSMDGVKTGYTLKPGIVSADKRRFDLVLPAWADRKTAAPLGVNQKEAKRDSELAPFIMDELAAKIPQVLERLYIDIEDRQKTAQFKLDDDLIFRWKEATHMSRLSEEQQAAMIAHCQDALERRRDAGMEYVRERQVASMSPQKRGRAAHVKGADEVIKLERLPAYFRRWIDDPELKATFTGPTRSTNTNRAAAAVLDTGEIERLDKLLASCLYAQAAASRRELQAEKGAFDIAWTSLLTLKAEAQQQREKPGTLSFCASYPSSTVNALRLGKWK